jgi:NAD-reducing hydrogenase large subunit
MTRAIHIDPVTRIEGHAKITLFLSDSGEVMDAQFHVTEFRGFEKFCLGRPFWEMPGITARVCGICPTSHSTAAAAAGDAILGVRIPPAAAKLRRLVNWATIIQSHTLSFIHLSGPDLFLGFESDPARRSLFGLYEAKPEIARKGIRLRQFGQEVIRLVEGRRIHPTWVLPGGVRDPLSPANRDQIRAMLPEYLQTAREFLDLNRQILETHPAEVAAYGNFPSLFLAMLTPEGGLENFGGSLRLIDSRGHILEDGIVPGRYDEFFAEAQESWSYMKFPYYQPRGREGWAGVYRVGPLARLNVAEKAGTPLADEELRAFRAYGEKGGPVTNSFYYHHARLIEILHGIERIGELLDDPEITDHHVRAHAAVNQHRGVGVAEAPRGTLFHDYEVDESGLLTRVNLLIATGQNNQAMNRTILQIAKEHIRGDRLEEGLLNRVEHGIRIYDPCLSCATHAVGRMPLEIALARADGEILDRVRRG